MTKEQAYDVIDEEPYLVGHWVGFKDLTTLHNEWIRSFLYGHGDQTLLAHRGSYKTTCLSIAIALMIVRFPKQKILFFRKTDDELTDRVKTVYCSTELAPFYCLRRA